jgi:hypothetical protein
VKGRTWVDERVRRRNGGREEERTPVRAQKRTSTALVTIQRRVSALSSAYAGV